MAKITYITKGGESLVYEANSGSLMELAVKNKVPGIDGDCGGVCSCATCHVHVAPAYYEKLEAPSEIEADMLEFDDNVNEYSRLCCQIPVTDAIDGITVEVAN
ncbi:2Fe-2S iron-sulfur cluster-binding protein [Croceivirga sp. JEA036]|uniref:2Fe-2S iron-sulfur cluster-binding protein n=1 Tax=Croceivirga sp. JEA036 TaxID=2721162 RepID=UPI0014393E66|nr:2Fe-2S iron-sulfur cluster-binding protein [Croceivirga sp. JEA036]NJB35233.1 2Fe-2S iron-sulfur cluster binding domain-containing protein [Croceivirga sp. JEA036]